MKKLGGFRRGVNATGKTVGRIGGGNREVSVKKNVRAITFLQGATFGKENRGEKKSVISRKVPGLRLEQLGENLAGGSVRTQRRTSQENLGGGPTAKKDGGPPRKITPRKGGQTPP